MPLHHLPPNWSFLFLFSRSQVMATMGKKLEVVKWVEPPLKMWLAALDQSTIFSLKTGNILSLSFLF
ncbi:hypothetical protein DLS43_14020 [Staphylococcus pseudintermedius]|nr:hypothetical protein DLS43_14020 [Staphylococcus pseudintermedius]